MLVRRSDLICSCCIHASLCNCPCLWRCQEWQISFSLVGERFARSADWMEQARWIALARDRVCSRKVLRSRKMRNNISTKYIGSWTRSHIVLYMVPQFKTHQFLNRLQRSTTRAFMNVSNVCSLASFHFLLGGSSFMQSGKSPNQVSWWWYYFILKLCD